MISSYLGGGVSNRKVDAVPEGQSLGVGWGALQESLAAIVKNEVGSKSLGLGTDPQKEAVLPKG